MALSDLATVADLAARKIDLTDNSDAAAAFLASASAEVRSAAGVPITRETFTVTKGGTSGQWLTLPGQPVVAVTDVKIDDQPVTDWKLVDGRLWRASGWQTSGAAPSNVTATITGGLPDAPTDIVDLVCAMVGFALSRAEGGYASRGDQIAESIDDHSEQFESSAQGRLAGPMELPEATRRRLRARFGGGIGQPRSR